MIKLCYFPAETDYGQHVFPLFTKSDSSFVKVANTLLPEVQDFINKLKPENNTQYVLANAMGASEWYGPNSNADAFSEESLVHFPDDWTGSPQVDKHLAKDWPYGFPTFYNAGCFVHHKNKVHDDRIGDVEFVTWNPRMKRVELVIRLEKDRCQRHGGQGMWDKLKAGSMPDLSMGTKIPFDTHSTELDEVEYEKAKCTFDPVKHKHEGLAILEYHKAKKAKDSVGIKGLAVTRADYLESMRKMPNRILPDGRKIFVYNPHPRFFDISFVFVGADKTAKTMLILTKIGEDGVTKLSADIAAEQGIDEKTASDKEARNKISEITKDDVPSQFHPAAVKILSKQDRELPREVLNQMGKLPLEDALKTTSSMGIILKPREFQRVALVRLGQDRLANALDRDDQVFGRSEQIDSLPFKSGLFSQLLGSLLCPFMRDRSCFAPIIEKRMISISICPVKPYPLLASKSDLLDKVASAYNGYRQEVLKVMSSGCDEMSNSKIAELQKVASITEEVFSPLSIEFVKTAYLHEFGDTQEHFGTLMLGNNYTSV